MCVCVYVCACVCICIYVLEIFKNKLNIKLIILIYSIIRYKHSQFSEKNSSDNEIKSLTLLQNTLFI